MKLSKAIKELERDIEDFGGPGTSPICQAEKLGIEALKRIVYLRKDMDCPHYMHLPGETEEEPKKPGLPLGGIIVNLSGDRK